MTNTKESTIKVVRDERGRFVKPIPTPRPFKVGDVVRISAKGKQTYLNGSRNPHDGIGTIRNQGSTGWWVVDWNNGKWNNYKKDELELVPNAPKQRKAEKKAEAPKFSVGDKVKIIKECSRHYHKIGDVGTIIMDDGSDAMRFVVVVGSKGQYMDSKWLEHVKDDEKPLTIEVPEEIPAALQTLAKVFGYRVEKA